ncbi:hypothetical protein M0651_07550 [Paenibacillus sp. MBLB2552]|uniref:Uncharacterized protein n=1 Tax=Paenibacillus mellifer TaxID=2937794 RepID=A0A9X1XWT7_9BACL|nr:hypothetical protein [Paenibacillus mellifer]MCK8487020.1 hypothetical protein [Paenibacillus mellifer]
MKINSEYFNQLFEGAVNNRTVIIDCVLDQYVVSNHDRSKVIGRPTLYFAIDKSIRMIRAFHLSIDGNLEEAHKALLEAIILNKEEQIPACFEISKSSIKPGIEQLLTKYNFAFSLVPERNKFNAEREIRDIQQNIDNSNEGNASEQRFLTLDELNTIINNWATTKKEKMTSNS